MVRCQNLKTYLYTLQLCLLFIGCVTVLNPANGEIFTETGLMDIPTGKVLKHGIFGAGVYAPFQNSSHFSRDAVGFRANFGMFDRVEVGLSHLLPQDNTSPRYALVHLKAQLLTESGVIPYLAVGIDNLGDTVSQTDAAFSAGWRTYQSQSAFLVISKTFNLPRIPLMSGHIGVGNHRFAFDERPIGVFGGVSTTFEPAFARGDIAFSLAFDGAGVNTGMRHTADSGFQIAFGVETLNKPDALRYIFSISWTNAQLMEQIAGAKRLARQAAKLANQAKRTRTKKAEETEP